MFTGPVVKVTAQSSLGFTALGAENFTCIFSAFLELLQGSLVAIAFWRLGLEVDLPDSLVWDYILFVDQREHCYE